MSHEETVWGDYVSETERLDWQYEVANGDTKLGLYDWLEAQSLTRDKPVNVPTWVHLWRVNGEKGSIDAELILGPFEGVQLTYGQLRSITRGDTIATFYPSGWDVDVSYADSDVVFSDITFHQDRPEPLVEARYRIDEFGYYRIVCSVPGAEGDRPTYCINDEEAGGYIAFATSREVAERLLALLSQDAPEA
jgi:hypothetical protein